MLDKYKDKENIIVHPDWNEYKQRKDEAVVIPFYPLLEHPFLF